MSEPCQAPLVAKDHPRAKKAAAKEELAASKEDASKSSLSFIQVAVFVAVVAGLIGFLQYVDRPVEEDSSGKTFKKERTVLTKPLQRGMYTWEMLAEHDGSDSSKPLWLSVMGEIFDVSAGKEYYGKDGGYHFFAGIDGSRAYVTGEFNETGLIESLEGFTPGQFEGVVGWNEFYHKEDKYKYVGKLIGHFYDENGNPTEARREVDHMAAKREVEKQEQEAFDKQYPSCNSRWAQQTGGEVWCSPKSGGIDRAWAGVPRKYLKEAGVKKCVCIQLEKLGSLDSKKFEKYDNCADDSERCST